MKELRKEGAIAGDDVSSYCMQMSCAAAEKSSRLNSDSSKKIGDNGSTQNENLKFLAKDSPMNHMLRARSRPVFAQISSSS